MYYLFCGYNYYPQSGLGDYRGKFSTLEEAETEGKKLTDGTDWYIVITIREDGELVEVSHGW